MRESATTAPNAASAVVLRRDGRVLLVQRGRPPLEGIWTLPGGRLAPGEDPASCARREIREETGLDVAIGARLSDVVVDAFVIAVFAATPAGGAADDARADAIAARDDARDARWATPEDLARLDVPADTRDAIRRALLLERER